ncbi:MAG TPA: protein kinase [Pyrinomonadaceae bacterium]
MGIKSLYGNKEPSAGQSIEPDSPAVNMSLPAGARLGRYQIRSPLGAGGMGEVYLAEDERLGRLVALKILPAPFVDSRERLHRFQQEARAASSLNHPNILTIHEIGEADDRSFIATEYVEGETLRDTLLKGMRMSLSVVLDVVRQMASALAAAHHAGTIHRDIKPENIMLREDGLVKVLDFGLAKLTEPQDPALEASTLMCTQPGIVMGTATYMSPEQARGQEVDARTDIWSTGVVLYEMLTGRKPFEGMTTSDVLASILTKEPAPLSSYRLELPAELEWITGKALSKDREERYQTVKDLLSDLRRLGQRLEFKAQLERSAPQQFSDAGEFAVSGSSKVKAASSSNLRRKTTRRKRRNAKPQTIDSVAVLPLVNACADPEMEYLSDGITESIINCLSQLPKLKVMARSIVFRYKGQDVDPQRVGRELGVRAVLVGRALKLDGQLIVGVELVDAADGSQLWGEHYNRQFADIFAVQEVIADAITEKLQLKLSGEEKKQLTKRYTDNIEAYQLYLQGRYFWNKRTAEGIKNGIRYFEPAIAEDPNYALAYAGLADCYIMSGFYDYLPPTEAFPQAKVAALKALEIDDALAEAHISLAAIRTFYEWDWLDAERDFKRGLKLNDQSVKGHHWYACSLTSQGRFEEGFREIKRAQKLEPLSLIINRDVGRHYYFLRQYDKAITQCRKTLELEPNFFLAHFYMIPAYERKGMFEEAGKELQQAIMLSGRSIAMISLLAHVYAVAGRKDDAVATLKELDERSKREYVSAFYRVLIYLGLNDKEQAFKWLERAYEERSTHLVWFKVDPIFDELRADPRFTELLLRIGLD